MAKMKAKRRINFIPTDLRPKLEVPHEVVPFVFLIFFASYASFTSIKSYLLIRSNEHELAEIHKTDEELNQKIRVLTEHNRLLDRKSEVITTLQKVLSKKNYWSEIFKELSILVPDGVWLTSFSSRKADGKPGMSDQLILKGESSSQEDVAYFLRTLEGSQHFAGAQMSSSERKSMVRPSLYNFEFAIPIKTSAGGTE